MLLSGGVFSAFRGAARSSAATLKACPAACRMGIDFQAFLQ